MQLIVQQSIWLLTLEKRQQLPWGMQLWPGAYASGWGWHQLFAAAKLMPTGALVHAFDVYLL
jgi:hypothetical protein